MSTSKKIRKAEEKIAMAQTALDKTRAGLRAAEEVAVVGEKTSRHPVVTILGLLTMVGVVWMLIQQGSSTTS